MRNKCPISPREIVRRLKDVPEILEWSKNKHLEIHEYTSMGIHHLYIDSKLQHVLILLKSDLTAHVFIGDPMRAHEWRKYDDNYNSVIQKKTEENDLQWKVYKDYIIYRGVFFDPKFPPRDPHWGKVTKVESFNEEITDVWLRNKLKDLMEYHLDKDSNIIEIRENTGKFYCKVKINEDNIELLETEEGFIPSMMFGAVGAVVQKISDEEKKDFCLWADLPQDRWTSTHYSLFAFGFINWLNEKPQIPKIEDVTEMLSKEEIPILDKPLNDIMQKMYFNLFS